MSSKNTFALLAGSLFFTILQPGLVTGLFPYWILGSDIGLLKIGPLVFLQFAGIVVFAIGLIILLECILRFVTEGRGTLSPALPTKTLVIKGLYNYSRNPMYVGVMLMLIGEVLYFESGRLAIYAVLVFILISLFIMFREEPRLKRDFGEAYDDYCRKVHRWM